MDNLVHLHLHTEKSLLDGYGSPSSRVKKAKELGMTAMAVTDHNNLGACIDFQQACREEGIKPILGVELYYTINTTILSKDVKEREEIALNAALNSGIIIPPKTKKKEIKELIKDYIYDTKQYHILFLAKNQKGWDNLVKLQSEAARICTYNGRFLCDDDLITKYKDGLIMTTACLGSIVNNLISKNKIEEAYKILDTWHSIFKNDFYIEIQPLNDEQQSICNYHLIKYALNNNINVIATNDVHYTNKEDYDDHDTLLCIGIGKLKKDENRMKYAHEFWVRSYEEMLEAFTNQYNDTNYLKDKLSLEDYMNIIKAALENTNKIADLIDDNINLGSDKPILPKVKIPNNFTAEQYLTLLSYKGLFKYLSQNKDLNKEEYINRLHFELNVINSKGYADYMLIVKDIIDWCEINDIPTGPGRGSASGSLVLFVNNITKCIDPIKYGLLFSRFLTMDRTALPD